MKCICLCLLTILLNFFVVIAQTNDTLVKKTTSLGTSVQTLDSSQIFSINVKSEPDSAVVVVDDSVRGLSPVEITNLKAGEHIFILKKKGFYQKKITISVDSLTNKDLNVVLQQPGSLFLSSEPSGAELYFNGEKKGLTPLKISTIKPGNYTVTAKKTGYEQVEKTVAITSGKNDSLGLLLPINKAYTDSLNLEKQKIDKKKKRIKTIIISSAFSLFAIIIAAIDFSGDK